MAGVAGAQTAGAENPPAPPDELGQIAGASRAENATHAFISEPSLAPPIIDVAVAPSSADPSLLFTTTNQFDAGVGNQVNVYDESGGVVFSRPLVDSTADLKVIDYLGQPALIWFEGEPLLGAGRYAGEWVVVDQSYQEIARFAGNGFAPDLHDVIVLDEPTGPRAILLIYNPVVMDLSALGGQVDATVLELVVQEVDITTGAVSFEWHSLDDIGVEESIFSITGDVVDYMHGNSMELDDDGNLLLSARSTTTVYKVDRQTGELMWRLGGADSDFIMVGTDPSFRLQHDVRRRDDGTISLFDNSGLSESRGLVYELDEDAMTATLVRDQRAPGGQLAATMGNVQSLGDGGLFIGWGSGRRFTQFDGSGNVEIDATFRGSASYRVVRHEWTGQPARAPAAGAVGVGARFRLAASWNGATDYDQVRFLEVTAGGLVELATVPRTGFETTFDADLPCDAVFVAHMLESGVMTGASDPVEVAGCGPVGAFVYAPGSAPDTFIAPSGPIDLNVYGTYEPVVGDFLGDGSAVSADEILWFGAGAGADHLWRFDDVSVPGPVPVSQQTVDAPFGAPPLVGDFNGSGCDDLLWYGPGSEPDAVWFSTCDGGDEPTFVEEPVTVSGTYVPFVVDTGVTGHDEVFWYSAGPAPDYVWVFTDTGIVTQRLDVTGSYEPVIVDVDGDRVEEVLWYAPGTAADYFWQWSGATGSLAPTSRRVGITGTYEPLVVRTGGALGGTATTGQEVFWYRPGAGPDYVWTWIGDSFVSAAEPVGGTYEPVVGRTSSCAEFDSIWWHRDGSTGYVWSFERGSLESRTDRVTTSGRPLLTDVRLAACS